MIFALKRGFDPSYSNTSTARLTPARLQSRVGLLLLLYILFFFPDTTLYAAADTTIVTFVQAPMDIMNRTITGRFAFPKSNSEYRQILMIYSLECSSHGCDPWDRVSTVGVRYPSNHPGSGEEVVTEIGRLITPPERAGRWVLDVTDYRSLLRDSVTLSNFINTSIGGGSGFLVTILFKFVAGEHDLEAYRVENLWSGLPVYGDPGRPVEQFLPPIGMKADREADFVRVNITATGHGEGNSEGAATYSRKLHELSVADTTFRHYLWRDDCADLSGTPDDEWWKRPRAGYCLGDVVFPWRLDISRYAAPGVLYTLDYSVEPYVNECRPRPDPCPCDDCTYSIIGHSPPFYWIESQAISYRIVDEVGDDLLMVEPGDRPGVVRITPRLSQPSPIDIQVQELGGELIYRRQTSSISEQVFTLDLSTTPGVYLLRVVTPQGTLRRRLDIR
ncbi:MAG: hypothetical protein KDD67_17010 [Ignavibacteriae bacterium]|nr:hypothetical protein [Ignavibacteriota bacterium]